MPEYTVSTDPALLDVDMIHRYLSEESYWAKGRSREVTERSIANSYPFAAFLGDEQVAFARVVTDTCPSACLADVFVLPEHRGGGLGKLLVESPLSYPASRGMKRCFRGPPAAHELYRR